MKLIVTEVSNVKIENVMIEDFPVTPTKGMVLDCQTLVDRMKFTDGDAPLDEETKKLFMKAGNQVLDFVEIGYIDDYVAWGMLFDIEED